MPEKKQVGKPRAESKARSGGGEVVELPDARDAAPLFRVALTRLLSDCEWYITNLKEELRGNVFHAMGTDLTGEATTRGVGPYPTPAEVRLITAYLMMVVTGDGEWREVEALLERLHPNLKEAQREKIYKYLTGFKERAEGKKKGKKKTREGLLPIAQNLARMIRGGVVRDGGNLPPSMSKQEQTVVLFIQGGIEKGASEEEIEREAKHLMKWCQIDKGEYKRLWSIASKNTE